MTSFPVRVVVFTSGPTLRHSVRRFLCRLEDHADIDLLAVYWQTGGRGVREVVRDAWRRRRILAVPVLVMAAFGSVGRFLAHPRRSRELSVCIRRIESRLHLTPDLHAQSVRESVRSFGPDVGLVYGGPILRPELFEIPALGTLGIHHGKLPEYRGKKTPFWALYNGESAAGVTIQKINAGLDTGDILAEGEVRIERRSLRSVWTELEELGLDLYIAAVIEYGRGTRSPYPAEGEKGKLYRDPRPKDIFHYLVRRYLPMAGRTAVPHDTEAGK